MRILRQKSFSKHEKKPKDPSKIGYLVQGASLSYTGGKIGKNLAEEISKHNQLKEVMERVRTDLPKRASSGDQKAAEMLSNVSSRPRSFVREISKITSESPRTVKAGKTGKIVGIAVPATLTSASYIRKKKRYEDYKKKNKE